MEDSGSFVEGDGVGSSLYEFAWRWRWQRQPGRRRRGRWAKVTMTGDDEVEGTAVLPPAAKEEKRDCGGGEWS